MNTLRLVELLIFMDFLGVEGLDLDLLEGRCDVNFTKLFLSAIYKRNIH